MAAAIVDYRVADAYPSDFISVELLPCVDGDGIGVGVGMEGGLLFLRLCRTDKSSALSSIPSEAEAAIAKRQSDLLRVQRDFIQASRCYVLSHLLLIYIRKLHWNY